jgi:hypothetical protein
VNAPRLRAVHAEILCQVDHLFQTLLHKALEFEK